MAFVNGLDVLFDARCSVSCASIFCDAWGVFVIRRPVNLSAAFKSAIQKMTGGQMEILYVPAGGTGRFQVNDTHLHKPLKGYTQQLAAKWHTRNVMSLNDKRYPVNASNDPITETDYIARLSALMSIGRLRNMAPYWLDEAVKHISKPIEGEGRNLLKKGWDELYMDPIKKEGFLEEAKKAQKDAAEKREKDKQVSLFEAMKDWEAKHGDISQFDASKVDIMSIHEQVALNVSSAESKYHKM